MFNLPKYNVFIDKVELQGRLLKRVVKYENKNAGPDGIEGALNSIFP